MQDNFRQNCKLNPMYEVAYYEVWMYYEFGLINIGELEGKLLFTNSLYSNLHNCSV